MRFERGDDAVVIAADLRGPERTVWRWRTVWREGRAAALKSKGPVSRERLSGREWDRLEAVLKRGPLAYGFSDDQRWTLGRIQALIDRLLHKGYPLPEISPLYRLRSVHPEQARIAGAAPSHLRPELFGRRWSLFLCTPATAAFRQSLVSRSKSLVSRREGPSIPPTRRRAHSVPIRPRNHGQQRCGQVLPGAIEEYVCPGQ